MSVGEVAWEDVITELGYADSEHFIRTDSPAPIGIAHLLRSAGAAGIHSAYLFRTSPSDADLLPARPAIYVANARDDEHAREIHRLVWNQGAVPYLIVVLPGEVRVYSGFQYERTADVTETSAPLSDWARVRKALEAFSANEINTGRIWQYSGPTRAHLPVDLHLLRNLRALSDHLVLELGLGPDIAHSLIGKYLYIRYLLDRKIIVPEWLAEEKIDLNTVLGPTATLEGLRRLVGALEARFKGEIFPLPLEGDAAPSPKSIQLVARVFDGMQVETGQLSLDFRIYDFSFIPVELLSSIYEQFLHVEGKGDEAGAYYTPEPLADYVLAELNWASPLRLGMRILDPCCGSGIFLVLAFRRLVELARAEKSNGQLSPVELRSILEQSIFGVERNLEACYVTEFSLLLTLLSYVHPPDLYNNRDFEFPALHNKNIWETDFFNPDSEFAQQALKFDWVIGNPPWLELENTPLNAPALNWIARNRKSHPTPRNRAAEAFLWHAVNYAAESGTVALIVHATSLVNAHLAPFRRAFFSRMAVVRVTNFSNFAYALFAGSAETPAASIVYRPGREEDAPKRIVHFGPFAANQVLTRARSRSRPWAITLFGDDIRYIPAAAAASGDALIWKMALWGSHRDKRTLERLQARIPNSLGQLAHRPGWSLTLGLQLRTGSGRKRVAEAVEHVPELIGARVLNHRLARKLKVGYEIPPASLSCIPEAECFVRKGRKSGLKFLSGPHLWIDTRFGAYSDEDFVLRHPLIGLSAPRDQASYLRALSIYLNSSIAHYLAFFESASWGFDRIRLNLEEARRIRVPALDDATAQRLADVHREITAQQREAVLFSLQEDTRDEMDNLVSEILGIPEDEAAIAKEFVNIRLKLDKGKTGRLPTHPPSVTDLRRYAETLRDELDEFAHMRHRVRLFYSSDLILCEITLEDVEKPVNPEISPGTAADPSLREMWLAGGAEFSQWVYVQRALRVFDGERVIIGKAPRLMDWTMTQAMLDSDDIISEVIADTAVEGNDA